MPYVPASEALNAFAIDIAGLRRELGPPPWRRALVGTGAMRVVLLAWEAGYESVAHFHPGAEEVFQVLEGSAVFTIGEDPPVLARPGQVLLAPRGKWHAIRVTDDAPLLLLIALAPNEDVVDETIEAVGGTTGVPGAAVGAAVRREP